MPEWNKYKIVDHDSGVSHVVSLSHDPTEEEMTRIIDSFKQDKINKEKEEGNRSLFSSRSSGSGTLGDRIKGLIPQVSEEFFPRLGEIINAPSEAIAPEGMSQEDVEQLPIHQRVGRLAQETASGIVSPEGLALLGTAATGPLGMAGASIVGGGQMLMNAPETVEQALEHPSLETVGRAGILGAGLYGAGKGLKTGVTGYGSKEGFVPPGPSLRDIMEEQRGILNQEAINKANSSRLPAVRPPTPSTPIIDAEFVDPMRATYRDISDIKVGPPQIEGGQLQLGTGRVIEAPGEVAEGSYVKGITPKEVKGTAAKKGVRATKKTLSSHEGEHTPVIPEEVTTIPEEAVDITPGSTPKEKIEGINKEKVTEIKEPPTKPKEAAKPLEQIENSWIREQETAVLKQMLPGSRGQLAREINTVLNERGAFPKEKVIEVSKEAPKKEVTPAPKKTETPAPKKEASPVADEAKNIIESGKKLGKKIGLDTEKKPEYTVTSTKTGRDAALAKERKAFETKIEQISGKPISQMTATEIGAASDIAYPTPSDEFIGELEKTSQAPEKEVTPKETPKIDENSPEAKKARQQEHVKKFYEDKKAQEAKNAENSFTSALERSIEQRKAKTTKANEIKVKSPLEPQKSGIDFVVDEIEKKFPGAMNSEEGIRSVVDSRMGDYTAAQKEQIIGELLKHRKIGTEGFEEKPKTFSSPTEDLKLNEASFNQYQELLGDLINHGEKVGHLVLRDIVEHGKNAGLDQETIVNDIIDNAHPGTTSLTNKAWNATNKIFNPSAEE